MFRPSALALLAVLPLSACVVVSADSHKSFSGRFVGTETLKRIEPGATKEYVTALIGEPTTRTNLSDGGAVWKWEYSEKVTRKGHVLFVVSDGSTKESRGATYVQFGEDGLVEASWQD